MIVYLRPVFAPKIPVAQKRQYQFQFHACHRRPERSFFWRGKQFPVCARCTGFHLGYLSFPLFLLSIISLNLWVTLALMVPTYLDAVTQATGKRESNNYLRLATGLMAGIGSMSLMAIIGQFLGNQILSLISLI